MVIVSVLIDDMFEQVARIVGDTVELTGNASEEFASYLAQLPSPKESQAVLRLGGLSRVTVEVVNE